MKVLWSFGIILRGVTSNVPATRGQYLTIDAMHARHDTAQLILGRGADYVMTVRASMPALRRQLRKLPWVRVPSVSSVSKDHGRRARRTVKVALAPARS
jgi:hypothetical protein